MKKRICCSLLICLILVSTLCCLTACDSNAEKQVADVIISHLYEYKDPSSIIVLSAYKYKNSEEAYVTISGKNSYGGTVSVECIVIIKDIYSSSNPSSVLFKKGFFKEIEDLYAEERTLFEVRARNFVLDDFLDGGGRVSLSIEKINKILNRYKKSMGWI